MTSTDWNNTQHRTSIAASIVQGVYIMERDRQHHRQGLQALAPPWWDFFHFQLFQVLVDESDFSIFGAIYEFKFPINTFDKLHPPRYVVAFRGTLTDPDTRLQDLKLDFQFVFVQNRLQNSPRVKRALNVVQELVHNAGAENVWLAGHSLGAAIALVVGRNLFKMGFDLESYLFNSPFSAAPLEQIKNDELKHGARIFGSVIKAGLSVVLTGHRQRPEEEDQAFTVLSGWTPYLFVNRDDPICSEYIGYFEHRETMLSIGAAGIGKLATQHSVGSIVTCALGCSTEAFHLLPTACLVINNTESQSITQAHGVEQWWTQSFNWQSKIHKY